MEHLKSVKMIQTRLKDWGFKPPVNTYDKVRLRTLKDLRRETFSDDSEQTKLSSFTGSE